MRKNTLVSVPQEAAPHFTGSQLTPLNSFASKEYFTVKYFSGAALDCPSHGGKDSEVNTAQEESKSKPLLEETEERMLQGLGAELAQCPHRVITAPKYSCKQIIKYNLKKKEAVAVAIRN